MDFQIVGKLPLLYLQPSYEYLQCATLLHDIQRTLYAPPIAKVGPYRNSNSLS